MFEQDVSISTRHGRMPAFTVSPSAEGEWPLILFYMDAPGFRDELKHIARRIAKAGYAVVLPDLYYRIGTVRFDLPRREETMSAVVRACVQHAMNREQIIDDTGAAIAFADGLSQVKPGPVGCVGYCMGGPFVTWAAAAYPDRIKSAAGLYAVRLVNELEQSPHLWVGKVQAEMYFGFGGDDPASPPETIEIFTKAMEDAGVTHQVEVHEGCKHGFCFPERGAYAPVATELVWKRLFDLWSRTL
ncbi:dienelactone hydrolase family protein [Acuticoccus mangrovi]|uniref:Dienelactone hydrolase family protein n=1 Tax=Acuticoccus mangrovi TaxID=2796142 RepID=A0A934IQW7_9HYPH|nr:dienelactone hydrolase family protein [Acuticoccus mangrovi]MBJ3777066.1 dienelactone hydrolase family protein [Acuticoccus mangrovi]